MVGLCHRNRSVRPTFIVCLTCCSLNLNNLGGFCSKAFNSHQTLRSFYFLILFHNYPGTWQKILLNKKKFIGWYEVNRLKKCLYWLRPCRCIFLNGLRFVGTGELLLILFDVYHCLWISQQSCSSYCLVSTSACSLTAELLFMLFGVYLCLFSHSGAALHAVWCLPVLPRSLRAVRLQGTAIHHVRHLQRNRRLHGVLYRQVLSLYSNERSVRWSYI